MRLLEARIEGLEEHKNHASDRSSSDDGSAFTDEQTERIKALFDERAEVHAGRAFIRILVWACCAAAVGTGGVILAYVKLQG
jgi:hypothetical protein